MSIKGRCAIAGLGVTAMGKIYGCSASDFAAEAIKLAHDDAGLHKEDVDGLLINANLSPEMSPMLQMTLGFRDLALLNVMNAYGSTAGTMIQYACMAIEEGLAHVVVLVYAADPLKPNRSTSSSYGEAACPRLVWMACASPTGIMARILLCPGCEAAHAPVWNDERATGGYCHLPAQVGADEPLGAVA